MTSPDLYESIKLIEATRRWTSALENLVVNGDIMPQRAGLCNKRLSLDTEFPYRLMGRQGSPRLSSAVLKYSADHPLSARLQRGKIYRARGSHQSEMEYYTNLATDAVYDFRCVWSETDEELLSRLCENPVIAEYEESAENKVFLRARRCSEGELTNCMRRLRLNGCPVIVCHEVEDAFLSEQSPSQSSSCLAVPPVDVENEKRRPPLPNDRVDIVVC